MSCGFFFDEIAIWYDIPTPDPEPESGCASRAAPSGFVPSRVRTVSFKLQDARAQMVHQV